MNSVSVKTQNISVHVSTPLDRTSKKRGHFTISTKNFVSRFGLREARTVNAALNKFFKEYDGDRRAGITRKQLDITIGRFVFKSNK